jgi:hypothetical protein
MDRKVERPERIAELINEVRQWPVDDVVDLMEKMLEIPLIGDERWYVK